MLQLLGLEQVTGPLRFEPTKQEIELLIAWANRDRPADA